MKEYRQLQKLDRSLQNFRRSGVYKRSKTTLSDADIMILFCVAFCDTNQKVKLSDIAKTLRVTLPAVTHKVNDLVEKNLVEKENSAKDLRVTFIRLTSEGRNYVESIKEDYYRPLRVLVKYLGDEDTEHLMRILDKISQLGKMQ